MQPPVQLTWNCWATCLGIISIALLLTQVAVYVIEYQIAFWLRSSIVSMLMLKCFVFLIVDLRPPLCPSPSLSIVGLPFLAVCTKRGISFFHFFLSFLLSLYYLTHCSFRFFPVTNIYKTNKYTNHSILPTQRYPFESIWLRTHAYTSTQLLNCWTQSYKVTSQCFKHSRHSSSHALI